MEDQMECRLLVADLIARCMDLGITRKELMLIVTGNSGDVATLLADASQSEVIETRVRHLREVVRIAGTVCGVETSPWLRTKNVAFGERSPLQTLLEFPDALAGLMHVLRRAESGSETLH